MIEALHEQILRLIHFLTYLLFYRYAPAMATDTQMTGTDDDRIRLPGFGLEKDYLPEWSRSDDEWARFPHAIADTLASSGVTIRERRMLEFINQITDVGAK
jgi:hypothetical protein